MKFRTALVFTLVTPLGLGFATISAAAKDDAAPSWEVNKPDFSVAPGKAKIDAREGTWMSLDVAPDGESIVFDLLGDIYRLPIDGGEAEPLTSGLAWDIQPRFSPDGKQLAFTSDRAGGDNLWTLELASGEFTQVTYEDFRLLNNASWSPDGQYLAARKHFTTSRSLGTGEIWLYSASGGPKHSGQQVVKRPGESFQKEQGEPVFTPDGSGIYFTLDTSAGDTFVYHQDSNSELFQIRRIDLADGEITTVAGGPGGAVRPTPSPDGKQLAFVKRVRAQSRLFVMDLASGEQTMIYDDLDTDLQETWAIQGLYPNMDWTPDSRALVFWAKGKIWRLEVASRKLVEIPFHVNDHRIVYPAVRFPVAVAPDTFATRMVRFARRAPDGKAIVFESLGSLYIKRGDSEPLALTSDASGGFDYAPVWSPDSATIYFLRWQDSKLSTLHRISAGGGPAENLDAPRGQYTELAINQDGTTLAYRKLPGSALLNPDWGVRPGIYTFDIKRRLSHFVSKQGTDPHFGPDARIYLQDRGESAADRSSDTAQTLLISVTSNGYDRRELAVADYASAIRLAPDGRHIAFTNAHQIYLTPAINSGQPLVLDAAETAFPTVQLSEVGGLYMHWSADATRVSWTTGAELNSVAIAEAFAPAFIPPTSGAQLSQSIATAKPVSRLALVNARLVTMDGERRVYDQGTLLIDGNRIAALGAGKDVKIPAGFQRVDVAGKTIIPGFIDIHAHARYGVEDIIPSQNWDLLAHLALGVTTLHDPSSTASQVFAASEYARAGLILAPRIFSTGEVIYGAKSTFWSPVNNLQDALAQVRRLKAQGAISVKNYNQPRREQRQQVVEAARQEGLMTVAEGGSLYHQDMNLIADGITGIEHNVPVLRLYDDVTQFWAQSQAGYTPTLVVTYGGLTSEDYFYQDSEVWKHPLLANFVPPSVLQPRSVRRPMAPESDYRDDDAAAAAKVLLEQGVLVNTGAHGQREGLGTHWELWSFVRGGFSPLQALAAATINPATYLGLDDDIGSLGAGKLADLVILDANPLDDIRNSDKIAYVVLNGRVYRAKDLQELYTGEHRLERFYWQVKPEGGIR